MQTVFSGQIRVDYSQFYVESNDSPYEYSDFHNADQANGLCGAVVPGHLHLTTAVQYGPTSLTVEIHDEAPPSDDDWEDVVEVSFRPGAGPAIVHQWDGSTVCDLPLTKLVDYRVRYSASGMDAALAQERRQPPADRYLLQFWIAAEEPDRVVRQRSGQAAYWHNVARTTPPPPPSLMEEWAEDREQDQLDALERAAEEGH